MSLKLIAFDGDDTLWQPLSGIWLSDRAPGDEQGRPDFGFEPVPGDPLVARRDDGPLFALRPEAAEVLDALRRNGLLLAVVSFNYEANVRRVLEAFGVLDRFHYVIGEWNRRKDTMMQRLVALANADGHDVTLEEAMLIDDDHYGLYAEQCRAIGARFACFGKDLTDLREVFNLVG